MAHDVIFLFLNILITEMEDEYPSARDFPDFHFPIVQAEITECSTYAVVCRLKSSPSYDITSNGGSFNLPEYPNVCVTIPKKAVAPKAKIPLQIKVGVLSRGSALVIDHVISFQYARNTTTSYEFGLNVYNSTYLCSETITM